MKMPKASNTDIKADIVIVGAGGAGLSAALTAAERGIKNIVILEARGVPGGNSMFAEGFFAMDSNSMKPEDIIAVKDRLLKRTMAFTHQKINPRMVSTLIDDVIEPGETRSRLIKELRLLRGKKVCRIQKKHGNMPM